MLSIQFRIILQFIHPESISFLPRDLQSPNVADEDYLLHQRECEWNNELVQFQMFCNPNELIDAFHSSIRNSDSPK
jgi:hypothetical protein